MNLEHYGGRVWMITVTAPGADVLPWDESGEYVQWDKGQAWNRTAQRRWTELHRWAMQAVKRELGTAPRSLVRVWQMQKRGVLHLHLVFGAETEDELRLARYYVGKLRERTREFGFGYVDAIDRPWRKDGKRGGLMEAGTAAGYLSRYLGESSQLVQAVELEQGPRRLVWVSNRLTAETGCTMQGLRRARYMHVLWNYPRAAIFQLQAVGRLPAWFRDRAELATVMRLARLTDVVPAGP